MRTCASIVYMRASRSSALRIHERMYGKTYHSYMYRIEQACTEIQYV